MFDQEAVRTRSKIALEGNRKSEIHSNGISSNITCEIFMSVKKRLSNLFNDISVISLLTEWEGAWPFRPLLNGVDS